MKKTFFIAVAFVCFSNFAFANDGSLKTDPTKQALENHPVELITKVNEETNEVSKTKSEEESFTFCYEVGSSSSTAHGLTVVTHYMHCTTYQL
ncbi:hypothetical protein [Flavobacterium laiguense]|uniref:Uncharacterized protein n=1 Tax=Flavobacterium laiguense TaxID=2169409 RepID=A0A2U1JWQ4_9FLAO|nr:hypothetical protein [Flavobacterium laiguense]PWA09636.1 hypothetical protein DB891_08125 [Flavobacterium laiguense]